MLDCEYFISTYLEFSLFLFKSYSWLEHLIRWRKHWINILGHIRSGWTDDVNYLLVVRLLTPKHWDGAYLPMDDSKVAQSHTAAHALVSSLTLIIWRQQCVIQCGAASWRGWRHVRSGPHKTRFTDERSLKLMLHGDGWYAFMSSLCFTFQIRLRILVWTICRFFTGMCMFFQLRLPVQKLLLINKSKIIYIHR